MDVEEEEITNPEVPFPGSMEVMEIELTKTEELTSGDQRVEIGNEVSNKVGLDSNPNEVKKTEGDEGVQDQTEGQTESCNLEDDGTSSNLVVTEENIDCSAEVPAILYWDYDIKSPLEPFSFAQSSKEEYNNTGFLKGCKWAPDGSCLLTNSDDSTIRLFNFPDNVNAVQDWNCVSSVNVDRDESWISSLKVREGGPIYDYCWYPFASASDSASSCFLTTAKDAPVHLWDASYGNLRATYRAYNDVDEPIAAYSVAFDNQGQKIYCGYEKSIRIFDVARPGRDCTFRKLTTSPLPDLRQHGLISCIAFNSSWNNAYACGSYRKTIGLYMEDGTIIALLDTHLGGVTHLVFSNDGTKLYSGARSDSQLICWDMRNMGSEYSIYRRVVKTQQRIYFELTKNDRYLISGGTDGIIRIWDTLKEDSEPQQFAASTDCINGISVNPYVPVIATATGQRTLYDIADDSDDEMFCTVKTKDQEARDLQLWKF